ncbi:MAG: hypothetical protein RLO81_17245, partial [Fulvivirga sp.]|uniref:hypothetical protein n=1 Tax=Fulvivirga sp. TaxID=1931237 RepID=UPI0032ECDD44
MKFHKYFLIVIIGITRCTPYPEGVMTALEHSGDNRQELEKAIFFFKTKEDNELKLRALYFLVEQIPYYSTLNYRFVNENNEEIPLSEWNYVNVVEAREQLAKNRLYFQKGDAISDLTTVTSDYLIKNVDLAFEVWQNYPWCSNLNFDQFCKYILPHKLNGDPLNNWREYYYNKHKNDLDSLKMIGATREQVCTWLIDRYAWDWIRSASIIPVEYLSYDKIKIIGGGSCDHLSRNQVQLMRACGIPMNMDIIPYHGRLNGGHSFTSFYDENNVLVSFYSSNEKGPDRSEWRAPKVLRYNFAIDYEKLNDYHARRNSSVFLSNPFLEDVTTQYFTSADISLNLENNKGEQI